MNQYLTGQVNSSSPGQLLILVLNKLKVCISCYLGDLNPLENHSKALTILTTLSLILDRDSDLPWIEDMSETYQFLIFELLSRDKTRIKNIMPWVDSLIDTWREAYKKSLDFSPPS